MNRDDVLKLAREADCLDPQHYGSVWADKLERFAALVADAARGDYHEGWEEGYKAGMAGEREECAKVCESLVLDTFCEPPSYGDGCYSCADAIRTRGNNG